MAAVVAVAALRSAARPSATGLAERLVGERRMLVEKRRRYTALAHEADARRASAGGRGSSSRRSTPFGAGPSQRVERLVAGLAVSDELRDERVVGDGNVVPGLDSAVDADASGSSRRSMRPGCGRKVTGCSA